MDRNEVVSRLHVLREKISQKEKLLSNIQLYRAALRDRENRPNVKLRDFDQSHKEKFIYMRVGEKPVKPNPALAIVVPVYLKKKKEYEAELESYQQALRRAEEAYLSSYRLERQAIMEEEAAAKKKATDEIAASIDSEQQKLNQVIGAIEGEDLVGQSLKNPDDIEALIEIFDNRRADSIKEAVNVLIEDKHRQRMEELQEEQVRLTQEAKDAAERAENSANEAIRLAKEAMDRADEAYDRADEAYREAEDAYSEARSAYNEATSN
jgi:hypothetical protein